MGRCGTMSVMEDVKRGMPRPLDAHGIEALVTAINREHATSFVADGAFRGGEGPGAYRLRDERGVAVLKVVDDNALARLPAVAEATDELRHRGYPAARYLRFGSHDGTGWVLQEFLSGEPIFDAYRPAHINRVLELNAMQSDFPVALPDDWPGLVSSAVVDGGDGFCLHETMREYSSEASDLLDELVDLTRSNVAGVQPRRDLVHLDFTGANVLAVEDDITGVIDFEAARLGDRGFDLVAFQYYLFENEAWRRPMWDAALEISGPSGLKVYFAHMILRQSEWSMRFHDAKTVRDVLDRSRRVLDELDTL